MTVTASSTQLNQKYSKGKLWQGFTEQVPSGMAPDPFAMPTFLVATSTDETNYDPRHLEQRSRVARSLDRSCRGSIVIHVASKFYTSETLGMPELEEAPSLDGQEVIREVSFLNAAVSQKEATFLSQVTTFLEIDTVEEGFPHPLDEFLTNQLEFSNAQSLRWIHRAFEGKLPAALHADFLRCLCRVPYEHVVPIAESTVHKALQSTSAPLREAAIGAVEEWRSPELLSVLRAHKDPLAWLDQYAEKITKLS